MTTTKLLSLIHTFFHKWEPFEADRSKCLATVSLACHFAGCSSNSGKERSQLSPNFIWQEVSENWWVTPGTTASFTNIKYPLKKAKLHDDIIWWSKPTSIMFPHHKMTSAHHKMVNANQIMKIAITRLLCRLIKQLFFTDCPNLAMYLLTEKLLVDDLKDLIK